MTRRYFQRNKFRVYANDTLVPGVARIYRDSSGIKVTRLHRTDAGDMTSLFGESGVLTVVMLSKDLAVARAFRIEYNGAAWDPLHLNAGKDQMAQEAMILVPAGDWSSAELDERHDWMLAYSNEELEEPPASKLVKAAAKKSSKKKASRSKKKT